MILNADTQLAVAWSPTLVAVNTPGPVLDLLSIQDLGMGNPLVWYTKISAAFTSGGAGTLDLALQGNATDPAFGSANLTLIDLGVQALAALTAKTEFKFKLPRGFKVRYLRVIGTIATAAMTGGTLDSWITNDDMQDNLIAPAGYSVS